MGKYAKAIAAFVALVVAILNARGFELPPDTADKIFDLIVLLGGTFGVFQITNKGANTS